MTTDCFVLRLRVCGFSVASTGSPLLVVTFSQILVTFSQIWVTFNQILVMFNQTVVTFNQTLVTFDQILVTFSQILVTCRQFSKSVAGHELEGLCGEQIATSRVSRCMYSFPIASSSGDSFGLAEDFPLWKGGKVFCLAYNLTRTAVL